MIEALIAVVGGSIYAWLLVATAVMAGALGAFLLVKMTRETLDVLEMRWQALCRWLGL